ncbi:YebC/PmpR family DNA-binding transcriptional regulator [Candidatus Gottesmanbacteria bacterium]|nr:YebC/PmpR family DNA-binding transcriptional regulator [Candidatus Gottesmanbacteria bacterium]
MSGHSKWSKVKHQKAGTDAAKGAAFTKASRAIWLAVVGAGGIVEPEKNFHLRLAMEKARAVNMPKDTIDRVIAKAAGEGAGSLESVVYEAIGPGGSALIITAATDNRQRTVSEIKNVLDRHGARLASPGAVMYQFTRLDYVHFRPTFEIHLEADAKQTLNTLLAQLHALEDVQEVYTNAS